MANIKVLRVEHKKLEETLSKELDTNDLIALSLESLSLSFFVVLREKEVDSKPIVEPVVTAPIPQKQTSIPTI